MQRPIHVIWQTSSDPSKIWEYDWIRSLLKNLNANHIFDSDYKICLDRSIVVTPGKKKNQSNLLEEYVEKFKESGFRVGFIHLGDEWCTDSIKFYGKADFIFRNYYRLESHKFQNCFYFPLGYKSGFCNELIVQDITKRKHLWSFADHVKGSRYSMIQAAQKIPGGFHYTTQMFDDPKGLSTRSYAELLNQTTFALCPRGNFSLDTFRLYEALEAGAIPVVEDRGGGEVFKELFNPYSFRASGCYKPSYWILNSRYFQAKSYWLQAYGSEFPCPRIYNWEKLEHLLASIDIEVTSNQVRNWWNNYKLSLANFMSSVIESAFSIK